MTAQEEALIAGDQGIDQRSQVVEPLTTYSVARARREYANQSALGFMFTSTNRAITDDVSFLADNAFTGGVDYDWRLSRMYGFNGYWAGSHLRGSEEAITRLQQNTVHAFQRPDADYTELDETATTLNGHAGSVSFGKISGERTRFSSYVGYKSPGFDSNDLGFQRRADERTMNNWFQLRDFVPGRFVRNWNINFNQWAGWNFGGDRIFSGGNINTPLDLHQQLQRRRRRQLQRRAVPRPRHARRARRARQPEPQRVVLRQHRQPPRAVVQLQRLLRSRRPGHLPPQHQPDAEPAAVVGDDVLGGASATTPTTTTRSG